MLHFLVAAVPDGAEAQHGHLPGVPVGDAVEGGYLGKFAVAVGVPPGIGRAVPGWSRSAALRLYEKLQGDARVLTPFAPDLDILVWTLKGPSVSVACGMARSIFEEAAKHNLHLALVDLPVDFFDTAGANMERDRETVTCVRSVLMKPEHLEWVDPIWDILDKVTGQVVKAAR